MTEGDRSKVTRQYRTIIREIENIEEGLKELYKELREEVELLRRISQSATSGKQEELSVEIHLTERELDRKIETVNRLAEKLSNCAVPKASE